MKQWCTCRDDFHVVPPNLTLALNTCYSVYFRCRMYLITDCSDYDRFSIFYWLWLLLEALQSTKFIFTGLFINVCFSRILEIFKSTH